jgi:DMSO/TMAO reductase YedYZ molybdopterin-dependent catalytic subunit
MNSPKPPSRIDRRRFLRGAVQAAGLLALAGCDNLSKSDWFPSLLSNTETLTKKAQRALSPKKAMAREYTEADRSVVFPANGNSDPQDADYQAMAKSGFADWTLEIGGLVEKPASFSLAELRQMPSRTQTTRHDCVEGWSAIATWTGVKLGDLLERVRPKPEARFIVFYCADPDEDGEKYYESIDFDEAHHPQTILAYDMNGRTLPVAHGAPIRLRVERQLGYKQAKYIMKIDLVESLADIAGGNGGYWEDQGYEWYAGI